MNRQLCGSLALAAWLLGGPALPVPARADVIFLDGGMSEHCSNAALQGDTAEMVFITGSRLALTPLEICTRAIEQEVDNRAANYNNRGVLYFNSGDYEAAIRDFDEAIRLRGSLAQPWFNKGYTLIRQRRWADSIAAFDRGIELGGDELDRAYYSRGIAHEESGNIEQAYYDYRRAAELNPEWDAPKEELRRFSVR